MKKKLLWKGTLKEMKKHPCYKYAIDEERKRISSELEDNGLDCECGHMICPLCRFQKHIGVEK